MSIYLAISRDGLVLLHLNPIRQRGAGRPPALQHERAKIFARSPGRARAAMDSCRA
jgi:hypothetical protein